MRKLLLAVLFLALCLPMTWAQSSGSSTPSGDQSSTHPQQDTSKSKEKKDKKKDKKDKKDKSSQQDTTEKEANAVFSQRTADDVLGQIRDGLEGHSQRLMLSAFDSDKMDGYLSFEDQLDAFFNRYSEFRVHFRIANVTIEGTKGIVLVDTDLEEIPRSGGAPARKRGQLRFELEQGRKGWKVVDFRDRNFFS